ncbi:MAG: glycosyltransferase family 9 protein [Pseudomonadota bacterium]
MSTDTMRWLDRWLGVPLCFLLSLGARWRNRRASSAAGARPRRVLCIQLAEMGSLVLAAPAVHWLQARGVQPWFVSFARNGDCLAVAGLASVDRVFLWRTQSPWIFAADFLRFLRWTWTLRFDAAIDFEPCSRFSALLGWLAGARLRAGYTHAGAYRGRLHSLPVPYRSDRHMSENCLALAAALLPNEVPPQPVQAEQAWRARLPAMTGATAVAGGERVRVVLAKCFPGGSGVLLLLNPNAGDLLPQRRWPLQRYIELARRLLERHPQLCIGIIGAPAEAATVQAMATAVASPRCASLAGALSVVELPALFAQTRLLVSNDSGPAHVASLTQTPSLVLFGPETPLLYRPLGQARALYAGLPCSPCIRVASQRRSSCDNNLCMQAISVESVLAEVGTMLDAAGERDRRVASANS